MEGPGELSTLLPPMLLAFWPEGNGLDTGQPGPGPLTPGNSEHECAPKDVKKPCRESPITADMVENLVNHLVPSLQGRDPFFVTFFLYSYRNFTTTRHVLDLLLMRYAYFRPDCEEDEQVKNTTLTLCSLLNSWIDIYPEEFCQTADLSILKKLEAYLSVNMPDSDLNHRVHMFLVDLQSSESESEDEGDSGFGEPHSCRFGE
ncbi:hypothetical protein APTSU1_001664800 [Apodemus speciosus]|uniref:N-terminal Ras-GEF domain-containing protein n=1 Tax=Apodemus speciosus TaxID=105296 RepID=A0ABQ0FQ81_APOSI